MGRVAGRKGVSRCDEVSYVVYECLRCFPSALVVLPWVKASWGVCLVFSYSIYTLSRHAQHLYRVRKIVVDLVASHGWSLCEVRSSLTYQTLHGVRVVIEVGAFLAYGK